MPSRNFALIGGTAMLMLGALALAPNLSKFLISLPPLRIMASYGLFLGFFPMNILNKLALMTFGVAGLAVYWEGSRAATIRYARTIFWGMGLLAVLGFFPVTNTLFGCCPLFGGSVFLHGFFAALGGFYGSSFSEVHREFSGSLNERQPKIRPLPVGR